MAYNLLDLRTRVRAKIKDTAYPSATIDGFVDDAIAEIADLYTFKQLQKIVSGSLTIGEHTFEQQADHQLTRRMLLIDVAADTEHDITNARLDSDTFFARYPAPDRNDSALPSAWTEYGDQIYFNCPVDKAYELRQFYQKIPDEMTSEASVPELPRNFREVIVLGAAYRCEEERQNYDIAAVLQNRFNDRLGDLVMRFANDTATGPDTVIFPGRG